MNHTTDYRIFVEKLPRFRVEAESLRRELNTNLNLALGELRLLNVYDLFGFSEELLEKTRYTVFGEVVTDSVTDSCDLGGRKYIAVECLPGQFDQRAASAVDCVRLIDPAADVRIRSSKLLLFEDGTTDEELEKIRRYYINAVESREKDLSVLSDMEQAEVRPVEVLDGFTRMGEAELEGFCREKGLAMNADDLREVVKYFRTEGRDPYETELRILDTYWSDHCRHTTFTTELEGIAVEESFVREEIEDSLALYLRIRRELGREHKSVCLMDIARSARATCASGGCWTIWRSRRRTTPARSTSMWTWTGGPRSGSCNSRTKRTTIPPKSNRSAELRPVWAAPSATRCRAAATFTRPCA